MTKMDAIRALANRFNIDMPREDSYGNLDLDYGEWSSGGYCLGNDNEYRWQSLKTVIEALDDACLFDDEEDEWEDD